MGLVVEGVGELREWVWDIGAWIGLALGYFTLFYLLFVGSIHLEFKSLDTILELFVSLIADEEY